MKIKGTGHNKVIDQDNPGNAVTDATKDDQGKRFRQGDGCTDQEKTKKRGSRRQFSQKDKLTLQTAPSGGEARQ